MRSAGWNYVRSASVKGRAGVCDRTGSDEEIEVRSAILDDVIMGWVFLALLALFTISVR